MLNQSDLFLLSNGFKAKLKIKETVDILEARTDFVNWDYQLSKLDNFLTCEADRLNLDNMILNIYVGIINKNKTDFNPSDYRISENDDREWGNAFHDLDNLLNTLARKSPATKVAN